MKAFILSLVLALVAPFAFADGCAPGTCPPDSKSTPTMKPYVYGAVGEERFVKMAVGFPAFKTPYTAIEVSLAQYSVDLDLQTASSMTSTQTKIPGSKHPLALPKIVNDNMSSTTTTYANGIATSIGIGVAATIPIKQSGFSGLLGVAAYYVDVKSDVPSQNDAYLDGGAFVGLGYMVAKSTQIRFTIEGLDHTRFALGVSRSF